jgi:hypothetical protein
MKKILLSLLAVILLGAFAVNFAQAKVLSGKFSAYTQTAGYSLDKGEGERSYSIEVNFLKPFETRPTVILSVTSVDCDKQFNVRYNVEAISVSRDGFTIKISTWADSKIFGITGNWLAHSE